MHNFENFAAHCSVLAILVESNEFVGENASTKEFDQDLMPAPAEGGGRAGSVCSAQVSLEESQEKRKAAREGLPVTPPPPLPLLPGSRETSVQ